MRQQANSVLSGVLDSMMAVVDVSAVERSIMLELYTKELSRVRINKFSVAIQRIVSRALQSTPMPEDVMFSLQFPSSGDITVCLYKPDRVLHGRKVSQGTITIDLSKIMPLLSAETKHLHELTYYRQ